jgi:FkbM family methyltransferase
MTELLENGMPVPDPVDVVVYHIGGDGSIGPVEAVFEAAPDNITVVIFEIRHDAAPFTVKKAPYSDKQFKISVNRAIDERAAVKDFHITTLPLSSSLFKPSPMASTEDAGYYHCKSWAENCTVERTIEVTTSSLADVIAELNLPPPDVISIDAQGAEFGILKGAGQHLDRALAVVSEVEFSEIYHQQPLFDDQMALLSPKGLRLVNLFNSQVWHPTSRMPGNGFLTVAEAVFVKYFHAFDSDVERPARGYSDMRAASTPELVKACIIAVGFRLMSYAAKIAGFLKAERTDYQMYYDDVVPLQIAFIAADYLAKHQHRMDTDLDFFLNAMTFPTSEHLKYKVPDTSVKQWEETKKRIAKARNREAQPES